MGEPDPCEFGAGGEGEGPETLQSAERGAPVRVDTGRGIGCALDVDPRSFAKAVSRRPSRRA